MSSGDCEFITTKPRENRAMFVQGPEQVAQWVGTWAKLHISGGHFGSGCLCWTFHASLLQLCWSCLAGKLPAVSYSIMLTHLSTPSKGDTTQSFIFLLILGLAIFLHLFHCVISTNAKKNGMALLKTTNNFSTLILHYYYFATYW